MVRKDGPREMANVKSLNMACSEDWRRHVWLEYP